MRFYLLLVLVPAAAFATASLVTAMATCAAWPSVQRRLAARPAAQRARLLAGLRLLPVAAGIVWMGVVLGVFFRFEARDTQESASWFLLGMAATTAALWILAAVKAIAGARLGRTCAHLLKTAAREIHRPGAPPIWVIDTPYPVAAVVGVVRTRLLVSSRILRECTDAEVASIVRHEAAHIRRRDNLIQAAMRYLPDPLAFTRTGRELQQAWSLAAEQAADDEAAGAGLASRTELASALVRVARMAEGPPPRWMPALAFFEGTHLEERVRRLMTETDVPARGMTGIAVAAVAVVTCGAALTDAVGLRIHGLMEIAVNLLP